MPKTLGIWEWGCPKRGDAQNAVTAGADEEIGAGAASPLTVVLPTKPSKTAMPGVGGGGVLKGGT